MEELICKECNGRKFRKLNASDYQCEYCGAIIKDVSASAAPKVVVIQNTQPQTIETPFPNEVSYRANLREGGITQTGRLIIYPDMFVFSPEGRFNKGNLSPREWKITDIAGYTKGLFTLDIKLKNGTKAILYIDKKKSIINLLEERRKFWLEQ